MNLYTLDTNVLIYAAAGEPAVVDFISQEIQRKSVFYIPTITITEFTSFKKLTSVDISTFYTSITHMQIVDLGQVIAKKAGGIRKLTSIHTVDAVVAATAMHTNSQLVTRNINDFKNIPNLELYKI